MNTNRTPRALAAIVDPVDLDAIRARLSVATPGPWTAHDDGLVWADRPGDPVSGSVEIADATFIARSRQDVEDLVAEVTRLRQLLDGPCGSCHPCTNYRDETWRAAERKPPHVIDWDDARAELKILRPIAVAAQQWAAASVAGIERKPHEEALYAAVQTLPDPTKHEALCPGFDCPGCRVEQTA